MIKVLLMILFLSSFVIGGVVSAADRSELYLPMLQGKSVALVVNHSSLTKNGHLVDFLLKKGIKLRKIFAPEHGFRGTSDAGKHLKNSRDAKTGLPIISLYGKHKKPSKKDLKGIDLIVFDIQDVGVRFYTYLSTLHYVMEAVAEEGIPLIVLDRPNPNGHYVDGPILKDAYRSFVGLDPVPVAYGMTIGEYARMLNGEGWLRGAEKAKLTVIPIKGYTHQIFYHLPIKPSPNLPNDRAVALYPSLALFEGTVFSAGRGTRKQFQLYGAPQYSIKKFSFVPRSMPGAKYPKFKGKRCWGVDLSSKSVKDIRKEKKLNLSYLMDTYRHYPNRDRFFLQNRFFDRLSGSDRLRRQILAGKSEAQIRKSWEKDLAGFRKIRAKYLLYR